MAGNGGRGAQAFVSGRFAGKGYRGAQRGFTLVEILVVVFIISIVLAVGLLSLSNVGDSRALRTEAQRIAALIQISQDEASMQGREFGIEVMTAGYRFVEYDSISGQWSDVLGDDTLRLRTLPENLEFELFLEDRKILLENDPASFEDPNETKTSSTLKTYAPHLMIFSSGDATPFELQLWRTIDDKRVFIKGDAIGAIEVVQEDEG